MDRRTFLRGLTVGTLTTRLAAEAQQAPRLGMLLTGSPARPTPPIDAFVTRLTELGWVEGRTLLVERRWTEDPGRLSTLAFDLVAQKVNIILTPGMQATAAAKAATSTIPIVMIASSDPVAQGLVGSLAKPGGNLTGVTIAPFELMTGKRLELLTEAVPGLRRVMILWDASLNPPSRESTDTVDAEARRLGVHISHGTVKSIEEFDNAFRTARAGGAGAVLLIETPLFSVNGARLATLGLTHRIPVMAVLAPMVDRGAFISYGPDLTGLFLRAATYVDKILRGASPAALPIEQPRTFALALNLKTAKALGIMVPPALVSRADRVIE